MDEWREPSGLTASPSHNTWLLIEREYRLLASGERTFTGTSVHHHLDGLAPRMIRTVFDRAVRSSKRVDTIVSFADADWFVSAIPVLSPFTRHVVAVQVIYSDPAAVRPPQPCVGAWEWVAPLDSPAQMVSYWSTNQYRLYGEFAHAIEAATRAWRAPDWLNSRIAIEDRPKVKELLDLHVAEHAGRLGVAQYDIITGAGLANPGTRRLQMVGRSILDSHSNLVHMRGVSHEVHDPKSTSFQQQFLASGFHLLTNEVVAAAIDRRLEQPFFVTEAWTDLGLLGPDPDRPQHDVRQLIHPNDRAEFESTLTAAAEALRVRQTARIIRFGRLDGTWMPGIMSAIAIDEIGRYAWVHINAV